MNKKEGNVEAAQLALDVLEERGDYLPPKAILGKVVRVSLLECTATGVGEITCLSKPSCGKW
ncbi:hypothetical protein DPMN_063205 [Dreissena polymorpha]|uniref:Uncharacterized protein n=1 Tax=Dreissena polymorpha TaxID=45954 RepID=A0A9D4CA32_DREPO|nr:hypothetical protein DPMN_063205 [Dreissena polymorpha]